MLTLALDTTTRAGSLSLVRDAAVLETYVGPTDRTHATRLPGDILDMLARHRVRMSDIELYAVAAGPGSFTGLRIGIATVQGLAFANDRPVAAISALDALVEAVPVAAEGADDWRGAWMDAQRGEVYGCLYRRAAGVWRPEGEPLVAAPASVLEQWAGVVGAGRGALIGEGALVYADLVRAALGDRVAIADPVPALAPAIATLGAAAWKAGLAGPPHAVRPVYIRRPDAELARERRSREAGC